MSCNKWELDAILEGLHYREIDQQENLSRLAMEMRYTMNAKRVSVSKLSKKSLRAKVKKVFRGEDIPHSNGNLSKKLQRLNDHFMNR